MHDSDETRREAKTANDGPCARRSSDMAYRCYCGIWARDCGADSAETVDTPSSDQTGKCEDEKVLDIHEMFLIHTRANYIYDSPHSTSTGLAFLASKVLLLNTVARFPRTITRSKTYHVRGKRLWTVPFGELAEFVFWDHKALLDTAHPCLPLQVGERSMQGPRKRESFRPRGMPSPNPNAGPKSTNTVACAHERNTPRQGRRAEGYYRYGAGQRTGCVAGRQRNVRKMCDMGTAYPSTAVWCGTWMRLAIQTRTRQPSASQKLAGREQTKVYLEADASMCSVENGSV